ncbi:hypothetical protein [Lentzea sp. NPDC051838]|uniref:hypothetical protein n=1 Tax=Lentzea sp. NPDC051838 TaxID=3154849 RepID=UPI00342FB81F
MRQAVVVIHGMGEQRAMDFLRSFVKAALWSPPDPKQKGQAKAQYWSKPDQMSELFEVRKFHAPENDKRPGTDFYEYYWAHHMEGNLPTHLWTLVRTLLLRWKVSGSLRLMWVLGWLTVLVLLGALALSANALSTQDGLTLAIVLGAIGLTGLGRLVVRALIRVVVQGFAVSHFGDVARYLDRSPRNVAVRQKIRAEAVELIRRIHKSGRYDRVVVVGHSLGSIIGYDALCFLYPDFNSQHGSPENPQVKATNALYLKGEALVKTPPTTDLDSYREAQREAWLEQRRNGNPWLVTDFVSLGSPLSHADMLFARRRTTLKVRIDDRELPTSPPVPDTHEDGKGYGYERKYNKSGGERKIRLLHHAALFGVTRWTNIFFPARKGMFGDWFAGPVAKVFGAGVEDVGINSGPLTRFVPVLPHILYFSKPDQPANVGSAAGNALRKALNLDSKAWLGRLDDEEQAGSEAGSQEADDRGDQPEELERAT